MRTIAVDRARPNADAMTQPTAPRPAPSPLFRNILGPALVLAGYLAVLALLLPAGINRQFVFLAGLAVVPLIAATALTRVATIAMARLRPETSEKMAPPSDRPQVGDISLLLLPMTPVLQYVLLNTEEVPWPGGLVVVGLLALLAALVVLIIPFLLRHVVSWSVTLVASLALTFMLYNMAALARSNGWYATGDGGLMMAIFAAVIVIGIAVYRVQPKGAYLIVALYFASTLVMLPLGGSTTPDVAASSDGSAAARTAALAAVADLDERPDIIVLTYDAYVPNETMLGYGIDNSEQEAYLESQGFGVYGDIYSVGGGSVATMGRLFGAPVPGDGVAGGGPLLDGLREAGYETYGVFKDDYFFRRAAPQYDEYFPEPVPPSLTLTYAILEGQFRFEFALARPPHHDYVAAKRSVLASDSPDPMFLYTHSGPSHSQNSGRCLPDEVEQYENRLVESNAEMREDIELVIRERPDAVIVVNGDHGPYLTKNCTELDRGGYDAADVTRLDIQDRFGTFLAVRWPEGSDAEMPDMQVLQDVMPAILSRLDADIDYDALRGPASIAADQRRAIAGLDVVDGTIVGGSLDGEPLFVAGTEGAG